MRRKLSRIKLLHIGRTTSKPAGFTLIELLITISILVVLVAVSGPPTLVYLRQRGVLSAADTLLDDLQRAKMLAIQQSANCSVTINAPDVNQYTISIGNNVRELGRFAGGVVFTDAPQVSDPVITFTPQGTCFPPGAFLLTNQENSATLRIRSTAAGGVSLHRRISGQWR